MHEKVTLMFGLGLLYLKLIILCYSQVCKLGRLCFVTFCVQSQGQAEKEVVEMVKNDTVIEIVTRGERWKKKVHVLNQAPLEVYKTVPSTRHLIPSIWPQIPWICRLTMVWGSIRSLSSQCYRPSLPGSLLHSPYWPTAELLPLGIFAVEPVWKSLYPGAFPFISPVSFLLECLGFCYTVNMDNKGSSIFFACTWLILECL